MPQISLTDAYELFKLDMKARCCEQSTLEFYKWFLGQFLTWCGRQGIEQIGAVSSTHIKQFIFPERVALLVATTAKYAIRDALQGDPEAVAFLDCCVPEWRRRYTPPAAPGA